MKDYFFVDGSSLIADIFALKEKTEFFQKKLVLTKFIKDFSGIRLSHLHRGEYTRFVLYFVNGDQDRINDTIVLPNFRNPGEVEDIEIKYCGKKLSQSARVDRWIQTHKPPQYVLDRLHKSEKAVDTQICCDALHLASNNRLDRLFLYTNDSDFIPLCVTLKSLGRNISLFRLQKDRINSELVGNCDSFSISYEINDIFE